MPTIGEKVKMLRTSLGLSQEQLAGKELTRSFISLVEKGKSAPSVATLQIIAKRLGKPVEFFLDDREDVAELEVIKILEDSVRAAMERKHWDQAVKHAMAAVHMAEKCGRMEVELRTRWLLAETYLRANRFEAAFGEYEGLYETCRMLVDRQGVVKALHAMGASRYGVRDMLGARRHYERVLPQTEGLKSLAELRVRILVDYGLCLIGLGEVDAALKAYEQSVAEGRDFPDLWGWLRWGLAGAYGYAGETEKAVACAREALSWYEDHDSQYVFLVKHKLAVLLGDLGDWDEAYRMIQECYHHHRNTGNPTRQASALIEIARYHLAQGDPAQALLDCQDALSLLDVADDANIRGRVYGVLGSVYEELGHGADAVEALRVAAALLRQVKNHLDLKKVQEHQERLRSAGWVSGIAGAGGNVRGIHQSPRQASRQT